MNGNRLITSKATSGLESRTDGSISDESDVFRYVKFTRCERRFNLTFFRGLERPKSQAKSTISEYISRKTDTKSLSSISEKMSKKSESSTMSVEEDLNTLSEGSEDGKTQEIQTDSVYNDRNDDYSTEFDYSIAEKSFSEVLPSKVHYDSVKSSLSDVSGVSINDVSKLENEGNTAFSTSGSFAAFNANMLKQYIAEEELRSQHQLALLKLREKAVQEKMKAELEWQKTQTQSRKDRRTDDPYPKKRSRSVLLSLEQEKAEIERRKSEMKQASVQRRLILKGLRAEKVRKLILCRNFSCYFWFC